MTDTLGASKKRCQTLGNGQVQFADSQAFSLNVSNQGEGNSAVGPYRYFLDGQVGFIVNRNIQHITAPQSGR